MPSPLPFSTFGRQQHQIQTTRDVYGPSPRWRQFRPGFAPLFSSAGANLETQPVLRANLDAADISVLPDCLYTTLRVTESHFDPCQAMPHVTEVVSFRKVLLHFRRNAGLNRPSIGFQSSRDAWGRLESLSGRREDEYSRTFSTNTISVKAHHVTYAARRSHVFMREPP